MRKIIILFFISLVSISCKKEDYPYAEFQTKCSRHQGAKLTILSTNDIHGHLEPHIDKKTNEKFGGLSIFYKIVNAIRENTKNLLCHDVLVLDAGDQFQGTLLSNYDEGKTVFKAMNMIGYDAIVPGNHDYDFGPFGWLDDTATNPNQAFEVISSLAQSVQFPLLSANTYFRSTITDIDGKSIEVDSVGCKPIDSKSIASFQNAQRPSFLKPYIIKKTKFGLRVAIIGLDNMLTPKTTNAENIKSLCFRDPVSEYLEIRQKLNYSAEIFILAIHDGNSLNDYHATELVKRILQEGQNLKLAINTKLVDAVIAGHTHFVNEEMIENIPLTQSGANARMFGRLTLNINIKAAVSLNRDTDLLAGIKMKHSGCTEKSKKAGCSVNLNETYYDSFSLNRYYSPIDNLILDARKNIKNLAEIKLGTALEPIKRDRNYENALTNFLTDSLKKATQADLVLMNGGGIRSNLDTGPITYESLFSVLPFNNEAVLLENVSIQTVVNLIAKSIKSCGAYGSLFPSGLIIKFSADCKNAKDGISLNSKILEIRETETNNLLYSESQGIVDPNKKFKLVTLDFLARGGSGYDDFKNASNQPFTSLGIARELIVNELKKNPVILNNKKDERYQNINFNQNPPTQNDDDESK
jgi:5'-nucleotidase